MKSIGFTLATLLLVIALGAGGYFAVISMTKPASYIPADTKTVGDLHKLVSNPETGDRSAAIAQGQVATTVPSTVTPVATTKPTTTTPTSLSDRIQSLIDQKITLKLGSKGASVGTVQEFMNLYFKKTLKIDNDYGKTLVANVKTFQTQNKITATGQIGPSTLGVMKTWLKNHPQ